MTLNFDFSAECLDDGSWAAFRAKLEAAGAAITGFVEVGPGGGNPNVTVQCYDFAQVAMVNEWYFGDAA